MFQIRFMKHLATKVQASDQRPNKYSEQMYIITACKWVTFDMCGTCMYNLTGVWYLAICP